MVFVQITSAKMLQIERFMKWLQVDKSHVDLKLRNRLIHVDNNINSVDCSAQDGGVHGVGQ